jgi:AcrR family transcriptional regulator
LAGSTRTRNRPFTLAKAPRFTDFSGSCTRRGVARAKAGRRPERARKPAGPSKAERRQHILSAARNVFTKRGYHHATIDDIVAEAGVARGTFYLYFEDKRAVFSDLIDRFNSKITMAIQRIDMGPSAPNMADQVRANIRGIIGVALSERAMTKILFTDALGIDSAFDRKLLTFYDTVVQILTESLREGQTLGIVADGEPRVLSYMTIGALKELLYQAVTLGLAEESADVLTQQIFDFLCNGYLRVDSVQKRGEKKGRR